MNTEKTKATKYIAYLRKSTDDKEKQVLSLESQAEIVKKLQEKYNIAIAETIQESKSAKKPGRVGFNRMMELIETGKADGIITWQISRLSRNMMDSGRMMYLTDKGLLKTVITEQATYSKDSMEQFMFGLQSLTAKLENDRTAYNVKVGMTTCARKGIFPSCPPLGYIPDTGGIKGARKRNIDTIRFPLVRQMWELMLSGRYTPYQILQKATNEWGLRNRKGQKLCKAQIYNIFNNTFYYGEFEWPQNSGDWYKGGHQKMITKEEFIKVQKMLGRTGRARPISHYFAYGGCVLHCSECGCAITGMAKTKRQKNGNVHYYTYYCCTKRKDIACSQKSIREEEIEKQVVKILSNIQIPESIHNLMMSWVKSENEKQFQHIYAQNDANKNAYETVLKKIDGLIDMRASGFINDIQFQERKVEAEKEKARLMELIGDTDQNVATWLDTADKMLTFAELAVKRFKEGKEEIKRGILLSLGWNLCINEKKLDLSKEEWIEPVKRIANILNDELSRLEPLEALENKTKIENLLKSPLLCPGGDLNSHALAGATTSR